MFQFLACVGERKTANYTSAVCLLNLTYYRGKTSNIACYIYSPMPFFTHAASSVWHALSTSLVMYYCPYSFSIPSP